MQKRLFPLVKNDIPFKKQVFDLFISTKLSKIKVSYLKSLDNKVKNIYKDNLYLFISNNRLDKINGKIIINNESNMSLAKYFNKILFIKNHIKYFDNKNILDLIFEINNYQKNINNENYKLKKMIISKIIIDLINSYEIKNSYINDSKIETIKKDNTTFLINNINYLKNFKLDFKEEDIQKLNTEEIYLKIIILIIKKNHFRKYEKTWYNIANLLELDSIHFTEEMMNKIIEVLNLTEKDVCKNLIKKIKDLFDNNKINFYFFLFKFIFKNSIYIYYCPFLLKTHRNIIKIINSDINQILSFDPDLNLKVKMQYISKMLTDSDYYYEKILNYLKLKEILNYYKNFYSKSKKDEINLIENEGIYKIGPKYYEKYLNDYDIAKKLNERISIIKYLYASKDNKIELNEYIEKWEKLGKIINDKKFKNIKRSIKLKLASFFVNKNNKMELKLIFKKEVYIFIKQKCEEFLIEEKNKYKINILDNNENINDKTKIVINENECKVNFDKSSKVKENKGENKSPLNSKNKKESEKDDSNIIIESNYIYNTNDLLSKESTSSINNNLSINLPKFKFVKLIGKHKNGAGFIKILNNDYLISGGLDKKLLIYNNYFNKIKEIKVNEWINDISIFSFDIYEKKRTNQNILLCSKENIFLYDINEDYNISKPMIFDDNIICFSSLLISNNEFLIFTNKGVKILNNAFSKLMVYSTKFLLKDIYIGGIIINKYEFALTSNQILENGRDELLFFDKKDNISNKIIGFSFVTKANGLTLISGEDNKNEILVCACKKYISNQKNGILSVNIINKKYQFYDTNNYEVYCFCPIIIKENLYILNDEKNKRFKTDYFLVGGFDKDKKRGVTKLYKIKKGDGPELININDIEIDNSIELLSPISCITQYNGSNNFFIVSLDGNISWFSFDLKSFLSIEIEEKIEIQI